MSALCCDSTEFAALNHTEEESEAAQIMQSWAQGQSNAAALTQTPVV